jgi:hypothetical protein
MGALTQVYKETVVARIQRDRKFAPAFYAELSMPLDIVHAKIAFKEFA